MLILITGLPATGKSHFAKDLALVLSAKHLNTDYVRKKFRMVDYSEAGKNKVYAKLFEIAKSHISKNEHVIVDGTFSKRVFRDSAYFLARETGTPIYLIECVCNNYGLIQQRYEHRKQLKKNKT